MRIIITGASSQVGVFLIPKLINQGHQCYLVSRKPLAEKIGGVWIEADLQKDNDFFSHLKPIDSWVHIAPLTLADRWLENAANAGISRFVGFSTTSVFTKHNSSDLGEIHFVREISATERRIKEFFESSSISWTVFRPTLIYGCGRDRNVAFIQQMISYFGFFPLVGNAQGLRQPVHAEDLADACIAALGKKQHVNKAYNLSGGETLTYRAMVERIFEAQNKPPRIVKVPVPLLKIAIRFLALLSPWKHVNPAMVDRINQNMVFDHSQASHELGFSPRLFLQARDVISTKGE